jgi:pyruvate dehydrogenase E1 component alpha subunit
MTAAPPPVDLYRQLYRIRRAEEVIAELYPQQQMRCPVHLCIGQEAPPVGVCAHLRPDDYLFSTHRSHGHYLAKGGSLGAMMAELYGRATGCSSGKGGSMHLIDLAAGVLGAAPILGGTIALAAGAAFGVQLQMQDRVTVAFFGDAAVEEGPFYECVNFAALRKLPLLLVCENNGLSTTSGLEVRQPAGRSIAAMVQAMGVPSQAGDGNDVLAVGRLAGEAVARIRSGGGPIFLEFATYRWREHCGPHYDFNLGYRTEDEVKAWRARCPLLRLRRHLESAGAWDEDRMVALMRAVDAEVAEAVRFAQNSPYPSADLLLAHEYAPPGSPA